MSPQKVYYDGVMKGTWLDTKTADGVVMAIISDDITSNIVVRRADSLRLVTSHFKTDHKTSSYLENKERLH